MAKKSNNTVKSVRGIGFYLLFPAFIVCLIAPFVHKAGFGITQHFSETAFWTPIIGTAIALAIALLKPISKYASVAMFVASLVSLLIFVDVAYLHLGSAFFNGVPSTLGGILEGMGFHFSFCVLGYAGSMILSIVAIFLPATKWKNA